MNERCPQCGFNEIEMSYSNIIKCNKCGLFVDDNGYFCDTDVRRFEIRYCIGFKEVYKKIYQIDLMKIIKLLEQSNNKSLSNELKKFIDKCEVIDNLKTDYERKLPKGNYRVILKM